MKQIFITLLMFSLLIGCHTTQQTVTENNTRTVEVIKTYYVAPYQVDCMGVGPQKCVLVKHAINARWQNFYAPIQGFEFESGFSYILKVKETPIENPPADGSSIQYELIEIQEKSEINQPLQSIYDIWGVIKVNGEDRMSQGIMQTIEINTDKMTVLGEAGCNGYQGVITADNASNTITFSKMLSTLKICPNQTQEDAFLKALQSVDSYYRYNQNLLLISEGHIVIEARRMD